MTTFLNALFVLCLLQTHPTQIDQNAWARASRKVGVVTGDPTMYVCDPLNQQIRPATPADIEALERDAKRKAFNRRVALELVDQGRRAEAIIKMEANLAEGFTDRDLGLLGLLYLLEGNPERAKAVISQVTYRSNDRRLLLVAAVLNVEAKKVAPGQNEYCLNWVASLHHSAEAKEALLQMTDARAIAYLALALECDMESYIVSANSLYKESLSNDGTNPVAAELYAHNLFHLGDRKEASVVAKRALARAKGPLKAHLSRYVIGNNGR